MKNLKRRYFSIVALVLISFITDAQKPFVNKENADWSSRKLPSEQPVHTVYLIGDAGAEDTSKISPVMKMLRNQLDLNDTQQSVLFLGDNIYPKGLPDSLEESYQAALNSLNKQLEVVKNAKGQVYFIPGNHDWKRGHKGGYDHIMNQQRHVNQTMGRNAFLPEKGCPGPVEVILNEEVVLLIIDTQWWLHDHKKAGIDDGCLVGDEYDVIAKLREDINHHPDKRILVVGHHPLVSNGVHGGHYSFKDHLFPLTSVSDALWIPLPVIGSIYPLYRKNVGHIQDIPNIRYRVMRDSLMSVLRDAPNAAYASGHDHHLEYRSDEGFHHVISGSGSKITNTDRSQRVDFIHQHRGMARLSYYKGGELWLEYLEPTSSNPGGEVAFRKKLMDQRPSAERDQLLNQPLSSFRDYTDSTILFPGFGMYNTGGFNRFMLGDHYRDAWTAKLEVPVIDLKREHGGLTILKRGGGFQTTSVRMENEQGKQYVLRSIQKDPQTVIPKVFRRTFARRILQDQISASHPYGAFAIPKMAEAAGIYHTNPKLMYVPDEAYLGQYREAIANSLVLYEERPKGDMSDSPTFGRAKKILGTPDVLEKIQKNHKHRVDQKFLIRNRIFDIFINDWDRHEDQWRWARFEDEHGKYYRPIPRDRDQVFYKFDGVINSIANRKWAVRKFQNFEGKTRDIAGLGFNARFFDRFFTTEMELKDWMEVAEDVQKRMTDEVIEQSIRDLPPEVFELDGEKIIEILKKRREHLPEMTREFYLFLNERVHITLTDKNEWVEVQRKDNENTLVQVYVRKKSGKGRLLYDRTFKTSETKEIVIIGLDGKDHFKINGVVKKGPKIRIKGGKGKDELINESRVKGLGRKTIFYDRKDKNDITKKNGDTKLLLSGSKEHYAYEPRWFKYNVTAPLVTFGLNPDDGVFFGGGVSIKRHGFEKLPYASHQKFTGGYAPKTGSFNLHYDATFIHAIRKWDLLFGASSLVPNFVGNFHGFGNESEISNEDDNAFYRIRYEENKGYLQLRRRISDRFDFRFGPFINTYELERSANRFVTSSELALADQNFERNAFGGGNLRLTYEKKDDPVFPKTGISWFADGGYYNNLDLPAGDFIKVQSELKLYFTLFLPFEATFAQRTGWTHIYTEDDDPFPFFQGAVLGGDNRIVNNGNLRGYRRGRFTGRTNVYFNNEVRIPFADLRNARISGRLGGLGFIDVGRVWIDGENSDVWHDGIGGGLWYTPFNILVISASYAVSDDDNFVYINTGFTF